MYAHHYAVSGLQPPNDYNVLSLEQITSEGNIFTFDDSGAMYRTLWCRPPAPTEYEAALLVMKGEITLKLAPAHKVLGERHDDLPCNECGNYTDTLIVGIGKYTSRDICHFCAIELGII